LNEKKKKIQEQRALFEPILQMIEQKGIDPIAFKDFLIQQFNKENKG